MLRFNSLLFLCLISFGALQAQTPIKVSPEGKMFIGKGTEFLMDTTNQLEADAIPRLDFLPVETDIVNFGNTPHTVWLRFALESEVDREVFMEAAAPLLEQISLYKQKEDGSLEELFSGGFRNPFNKRPILTENWLFNLELEPGQSTTFYLQLRSGFPFLMPLTISTSERFVESNLLHTMFWGLYGGVMLFAILYNFFIFLSLKERAYFYYILYIISSVIFYLGLQGYSYMFIWPNNPGINLVLPLFIAITNITITLFGFRFLQIDRSNKVPFYWGWTVIVIFTIISVMSFIAPYPIVTGLAQMFSMVAAIFFIYLGVYGWVKKIPTARYFLIAWTLFLVLVIIYLLTINNVLPGSFFTTHGIFIGHMTEVLLLSFALADRINWLKDDNEQKQNLIIEQLQENKRIQTKANLELEQKVEERTAEVVEQKNEAYKQKERSDELLLNILPEETAEELKATGHAQAQLIENVTVLFTDIEGFSQIAEQMSSKELVAELNEVFSAFDDIVAKRDVEKIKTIGDSYMAAAGVPTPSKNHALDALETAIEMRDFMDDQYQRKTAEGKKAFQIRIGLHTGPVVAGVVGVRKFAYDIWGKTVNVASRMESTGEVGKINISKSTYELIKDQYDCTPRGQVEAKNMGAVEMYYVDKKKKA